MNEFIVVVDPVMKNPQVYYKGTLLDGISSLTIDATPRTTKVTIGLAHVRLVSPDAFRQIQFEALLNAQES